METRGEQAPPSGGGGGGGEEALWPRVVRGDRAAAERLAERTYRDVYGALFKMCGGDAELAADLTQETYRKAWVSIGKFNGRSRFATWLYRIAYNTFLNHVRRPARVIPLDEQSAAAVVDPRRRQDERFDASRDAERTRRAVLDLPDDLRYTVTARFWAELPVREIAEEQGITGVAVRKRLKRAYERLALALEEDLS